MNQPTSLQRLQARRAARAAALRGLPLTVCPYRADGDPAERLLLLAFTREYLRHRPPAPGAIDHTT